MYSHTHVRAKFSSFFHSHFIFVFCSLCNSDFIARIVRFGQITNFILKSIYRNGILSMHARLISVEHLKAHCWCSWSNQFLLFPMSHSFAWSSPSSSALPSSSFFVSVKRTFYDSRAIRLHLMDLHELIRYDTATFSWNINCIHVGIERERSRCFALLESISAKSAKSVRCSSNIRKNRFSASMGPANRNSNSASRADQFFILLIVWLMSIQPKTVQNRFVWCSSQSTTWAHTEIHTKRWNQRVFLQIIFMTILFRVVQWFFLLE